MTEQADGVQTQNARMEAFLQRPLLARLATLDVTRQQPHVVPVWYLWDGESVWISAYRSTRKVRELQEHPNCSIVIDTTDEGAPLQAVLFEGKAELVTGPLDFLRSQTTRIYTRYLGPEGVLEADPQEWIHSPENLLIKLTPERTYSW